MKTAETHRPFALVLIFLIALGVLVAISCTSPIEITVNSSDRVTGSGSVIQEQRQVSGVRRVEVRNSGDLTIEFGPEEALIIEAEENVLPYIESDVRGGTLVLSTRSMTNLNARKPIRYFLTVTSLEGVSTTSSGDITVPEVEADRFEIEISSSGDISLESLIADSLEVDISSSGSVQIMGGEVERQDIRISSSGSYEADELQSVRATVRLSSSGSATIRVSDDLNANLSSSGDLMYIGDPNVDARESSSGDVERLR